MASLSPIEMINNYNNNELKDLSDKQKDYEQIDTILHVTAATINVASVILSTLAGIHWEYLAFVAMGCSAGTVALSGAIKANTINLINNNTTINNLLKQLKINTTVPLLDATQTTPVNTPN